MCKWLFTKEKKLAVYLQRELVKFLGINFKETEQEVTNTLLTRLIDELDCVIKGKK